MESRASRRSIGNFRPDQREVRTGILTTAKQRQRPLPVANIAKLELPLYDVLQPYDPAVVAFGD